MLNDRSVIGTVKVVQALMTALHQALVMMNQVMPSKMTLLHTSNTAFFSDHLCSRVFSPGTFFSITLYCTDTTFSFSLLLHIIVSLELNCHSFFLSGLPSTVFYIWINRVRSCRILATTFICYSSQGDHLEALIIESFKSS